jgi:NADH-quinone oxidoreductase subunit C
VTPGTTQDTTVASNLNPRYEQLAAAVEAELGGQLQRLPSRCGELGYCLAPEALLECATVLRDGAGFKFEMLVDVCGVDYLDYGRDEWRTSSATGSGFSRGVDRDTPSLPGDGDVDGAAYQPPARFAVVYHLLSITHRHRLRLKVFCADDDQPMVPSVIDIWASANWFEREAFDLYGILFTGHPDLRRILTDYGFIGHPFRKDFPLTGNVEMRYDPEKGRVVYQPVTIEPRTLVPKVIRVDNRYTPAIKDKGRA